MLGLWAAGTWRGRRLYLSKTSGVWEWASCTSCSRYWMFLGFHFRVRGPASQHFFFCIKWQTIFSGLEIEWIDKSEYKTVSSANCVNWLLWLIVFTSPQSKCKIQQWLQHNWTRTLRLSVTNTPVCALEEEYYQIHQMHFLKYLLTYMYLLVM